MEGTQANVAELSLVYRKHRAEHFPAFAQSFTPTLPLSNLLLHQELAQDPTL